MAARNGRDDPWPVAVFAHNEEENIRKCLDSLHGAAAGHPLAIYVLANGCRDATEEIVNSYATTHPNVRLMSIAVGDKSNAWNLYLHEIAPPSDIYLFVDGDMRIRPGAFAALAKCIDNDPSVNSVSGVPFSGRSARRQTAEMLRDNGLTGNLYALSGRFGQRIREMNVRLPVGFIGEDGLIGQLSLWDLDPTSPVRNERNRVCVEAGFEFDSFSVLSLSDLRTYYRRLIRYSLRRYQFQMLGPMLKSAGLAVMPQDVRELYLKSPVRCRLDRLGISTYFDAVALRKIRQIQRTGAVTAREN